MVFNCLLGETARIKIRLTETKHFKIMDTFGFDHLSLRKNKKHTTVINIREYKRFSGRK